MIGRKPSFGSLKLDMNSKLVKKPNNNLIQSSLSIAKSKATIADDSQYNKSTKNPPSISLKKRGKSSEKIQAVNFLTTAGGGKKKAVQASMSNIQMEKDAAGLLKMPSTRAKNLQKTSSSKSLQAHNQKT